MCAMSVGNELSAGELSGRKTWSSREQIDLDIAVIFPRVMVGVGGWVRVGARVRVCGRV